MKKGEKKDYSTVKKGREEIYYTVFLYSQTL